MTNDFFTSLIYVPKFDNLYKKRYIGYILDMYASCKDENIFNSANVILLKFKYKS